MITKLQQKVTRKLRKAVYERCSLNNSDYSLHDLRDLDSRYQEMNRQHAKVHQGVIRELHARQHRNVLEVACGTGWNVQYFKDANLEYFGLDISETAVAVAALKYPEFRYFNLGICDAQLIRDNSFDAVYNSSMLEHIGNHAEAIQEMIRLARLEVYILFFEGLSDASEHQIEFHPFSEAEIAGANWRPSRTSSSYVEKNVFGRKLVLQDHGAESRKGWYWNRYSKKRILELFDGSSHQVEVWDRSNRPYFDNQSVLVIRKR